MEVTKELVITPEIQQYRESLGRVSPILVAELLGTPLHEGQKEIAQYFEAPLVHTWSHLTVLIARRWGKTFLGEDIATTLMLTPHSHILVICHSTSLSDVWYKSILRNLMKIPSIKDKVTYDKKAGIIEILEMNTILVCCSYLNADSRAIGKSFSHILKDEHFLVPAIDQEEIHNLISPTQANYGSKDGIAYGKTVIFSTPRNTMLGTHAGRTFHKGLEGHKGYVSFKRTIYDSPFLTPEEIEHIKQTTDKDSFNQEYLCEFTSTQRTVFRNFNKDKHIIKLTESQLRDMMPHCELIVALDFGIIDGNGATIALYNNKRDCYYVIDEYYAKDEVTYDFLKVMRNKLGEWCNTLETKFNNILWLYDSSALEAARIAMKEFNLALNKASNKRAEGIDHVNKLLQGAGDAQVPKLYFRDTCKTHISMFEHAEYKVVNGTITTQFAKDQSERQSHFECAVTTVYICYTHFKMAHNTTIVI